MSVTDLSALLAPVSIESFLGEYMDKECLHIPGRGKHFDGLMGWGPLNALLARHQMDVPRFRLFSEGKMTPPEEYIHTIIDKHQKRSSRVRIPEFTKLLRQGATLVFDSIDQQYEPVTRLVEALERQLKAPVWVNLYASWRTSRGFDLHLDDHDVFILQIDGKKLWELHGETERWPLERRSQKPPDGGAVWREYLRPGDVLYIPRGHWHVAIPCDEPTLHLTVGFMAPTGMDVINWLAGRLASKEILRRCVPRLAGEQLLAKYWTDVRKNLIDEIDSAEVLERFFSHGDAMRPSRPIFGLPWIATPEILPKPGNGEIVVRPARGLVYDVCEDQTQISISAGGQVAVYDRGLAPLFEALSGNAHWTINSFCDKFDAEFGRDNVLLFLSDLAIRDIVVLQERS